MSFYKEKQAVIDGDSSSDESTTSNSVEGSRKLTNQLRNEMKLKKKLAEDEKRRARAIKSMHFLLNKSQVYSRFLSKQLEADRQAQQERIAARNNRPRKDTAIQQFYADKENLPQAIESHDIFYTHTQPKYFNGTLRSYQIEGLTWLKLLFENGINGILADEMGLGKTIQVIALICHLVESGIHGPFLITVPLSTIPNWVSEFKKFAPKLPVLAFCCRGKGNRNDLKSQVRNTTLVDGKRVAPVIITSYQIVVIENNFLSAFKWRYLIIDEAQCIKNDKTQLHMNLARLHTYNRILLTGTPLQNNMNELWALLHFLMPDIFGNSEIFTSLFEIDDLYNNMDKMVENEKNTQIISTLHGVLAPFMLRRMKSEVLGDILPPKKEVLVECRLTDEQKELYKNVLQKNIALLRGITEDDNTMSPAKRKRRSMRYQDDEEIKENMENNSNNELTVTRLTMAAPFVMLSQIVNHPYLIQMPVQVNAQTNRKELKVDENIIRKSGKMILLDAMLAELKANGHKVLLFSKSTMMLDILEDYMLYRDYNYCRLDGRVNMEDRDIQINAFNEDSNVFVFLITTRAGGLGLNLTAADTVILYDSDWNPQADLQAQARCHRIGQTKPVVTYRFKTTNTVEERVISLSIMKRRLEKIVIRTNHKQQHIHSLDLNELEELLKSIDHQDTITTNLTAISPAELKTLLDRTDLEQQMVNKQAIK